MKSGYYHAKMESETSMDAMKTRTPTATPNGEEGRAHGAPAGYVKAATWFNVALCAAACAVACAWKCYLPALGLGAACAVSIAMLTTFKTGGAE